MPHDLRLGHSGVQTDVSDERRERHRTQAAGQRVAKSLGAMPLPPGIVPDVRIESQRKVGDLGKLDLVGARVEAD